MSATTEQTSTSSTTSNNTSAFNWAGFGKNTVIGLGACFALVGVVSLVKPELLGLVKDTIKDVVVENL